MKKALLIQNLLDEYIPEPKGALTHSSIYTLLIAVLLSAQCTDKAVNEVTPFLFAKADTPEKMVLLGEKEVYSTIKRLGLAPTKSKAIIKLSKILIEEFASRVPKTLEELQTLPGVGRKTASVVLSQGFSIPAFPVDTHIFRCAKRWGLSKGKTPLAVEKDLRKIFQKDCWIKLHLQIILFARKYCPAKAHNPENCPICSSL